MRTDFIMPMLLDKANAPFDSEKYIYELKYDGVRMIADLRYNDIKLYNRNQNIRTHIYPEIETELKKIKAGTVLDGEIIAIGTNGKPDFYRLLSRDLKKTYKNDNLKICFVVFDVMFYENNSVMNRPLLERKNLLQKLLPLNMQNIITTEYFANQGKSLFNFVEKNNLEGIVAKKSDSTYKPGIRSDDWIKIKAIQTIEAVIGGYEIDEKLSLLIGRFSENKKLIDLGKVSNGLNIKTSSSLLSRLVKLHNSDSPFIDAERHGAKVQYVNPLINIKVEFLETLPNGRLRQPVLKSIYQ